METTPIYHSDAYARTFDATVLAVTEGAVLLDATAFFPGGGGQPADHGWIDDASRRWTVTGLRREGAAVWHDLSGESGAPAVGALVRGELDWTRRYALMRTHTALHILCGVVWRDYGAKVTGGNMEPLAGRMDFEFETLRAELIREIEEKVNAEVRRACPIRVAFLSREDADRHPDLIRTKVNLLPPGIRTVRTVEIEGLDVQADGGTHVATTAEVGGIGITGYKSKGRINKRIEIALPAA